MTSREKYEKEKRDKKKKKTRGAIGKVVLAFVTLGGTILGGIAAANKNKNS